MSLLFFEKCYFDLNLVKIFDFFDIGPIIHVSFATPSINNWEQINRTFLEQKWEEMSSKTYNLEKAYAEFWLKLIEEYKNHPIFF